MGPIVIDLYLASKEDLMDIPGVDEKTSETIIKARTLSCSLAMFIDRGGFKVLMEDIQYDVGLLARKEMILAFKKKKLDRKMLRKIECDLFGSKVLQWRQRERSEGVEIVITYLSAIYGRFKYSNEIEMIIKAINAKFIKAAKVKDKWSQLAKDIVDFIPNKVMKNTTIKTRV